ncbi:5'-methylthioadenosine/S-adenosylhomocysteine nucleosidase family protein [Acetobacter thailandicus]|uniref:5'-methylthioadenosine/S-adenosylhomocysteine nucleosidase family protein n=1 Tax=Acetobacter thailandicus TaxID=1502842 RepID=UPI001BAD9D3A|nr:hypothetical protein [Acetobacter thailandicus]MBS1004675.1 hypothetical protein [Acetobacter thailandicus]
MEIHDERPRILAIIALDEEYDIFLQKFPTIRDECTDTQLRFEHDSGNTDIRLFSVLSTKMGAKSSAFSTEAAIKSFDPHAVVVVGIAGGITDDVKLGDVCISNEVIDVLHNNKFSDLEKDGDNQSIVRFSPDFHQVDAEYISTFTFLKIHPSLRKIYGKWQEEATLNASLLEIPNNNTPYNMHIGPIVCGPVSSSKAFNEKLKGINRKFIALETESGGVFSWCEQYKKPAIAIRGISDMADAHKGTLESSSSGNYRALAMENAISILKAQMENSRFFDFLKKNFREPN